MNYPMKTFIASGGERFSQLYEADALAFLYFIPPLSLPAQSGHLLHTKL